MTSSTQENVLSPSDVFLVQRPSVASGGLASTPNFKVSAHHIGIFTRDYFDADLGPLKLEFEDIKAEQDMILNQIIPTIKMTLTDHDIRIKVVEDITQEHELELAAVNTRIDDALGKTRLFLYHKLLVGVDVTSSPGEMVMLGDNDAIVDELSDVTHIEYFLLPTQNIANVFVGETLEITSQRGVTGTDNVAFSHRAIYKINEIIQLGGDRIVLKVSVRNSIGSSLPEFQTGLDNYVRSDLYPIFTITKEEYDEDLEKTYKKTGGTVTGNITINKSSPKIILTGSGGQIDFQNNLVLRDSNSGGQVANFQPSGVNLRATVNVNDQKIINLKTPTADSDAATKAYVDATLNVNDVTEDDLFKAGQKVAATNKDNTEVLGFFYENNALYFKVR